MEDYKNMSGHSNVSRFKIEQDCITVEFKNGQERFYKYTCSSAGTNNIEQMKQLALQGYGLNSFIIKHVKKDYETKW